MKTFKTLMLVIALLAASQLSAQSKRIEIQGHGEMKVAPDQGILFLNISSHEMEFGKAVNSLAKKEKDLIKKLESLGYKKEDIRTANFSVNKNIIWRNGTRFDSGYIASQYLSLKFPNTKERIGKILGTFAEGKTDAEISFNFKLSDELEQEMNAKVLEIAVADAKRNAELLAQYNGIKLKSVLKIEYHLSNNNNPRPMYEMKANYAVMDMERSENQSGGFQAQDVTISDQVVIHYEIE